MANPVPSQLTPYPDFNSFFCKLPEEEQKKVIPPQGTQILEETNPNPESRRNSPSPFFVSFSQNFFTDNNRKWYYIDKQSIAQFIAEIIVLRVTFIFQSDKDLPLALSVYYYSGNRLSSTSFTFSLFNSDSLYKEFYIREYSSSCPVKIRNDLLRYCIANARYVTRFNLPQYMGWISARSNSLFAASDFIDKDLLEYCSPEIRERRIAPLIFPIESLRPNVNKAFSFLLVLRCSSILLTFYAEMGHIPDCIFLIENTAGVSKPALMSLLSNTAGCTPRCTIQKKDRAALLRTLNTTNDGLAVIHFDESAKYGLQDIHQVLTEDLQRMMNSGSRPLHIPI